MLAALSIRDIVLIDRLDLEFGPGLTVLTGETGAGKSIVLDALALALGARGEAGLVRHGAAQASVAAAFSGASADTLGALLAERGIEAGEEVVLRRVQHGDGRTRAFINDEPVSVALMREAGRALVEIHGQHDERALLEPAVHLQLVDAFGEHSAPLGKVNAAWAAWRGAEEALAAHHSDMARSLADAEFLRHSRDELASLAPSEGEEARLARDREMMMAGEKIAGDLARATDSLSGEGGALDALARSLAALEAAESRAPGLLSPAIAALTRGEAEIGESVRALAQVQERAENDPARLEEVEERLFALRAAARKHGVAADALPDLAATLSQRLDAIEHGEERLAGLAAARDAAREAYIGEAAALSAARRKAAKRLDKAVEGELGPLRLESARFETRLETLDEERAGPLGRDRAEFMIAANPGVPAGPLRRVASGGELSRVMLALKVALAGRGGAPTLIFDEIDSGVGGAVAASVGERLGRLGAGLQVLVVTHSPQVAARADSHFLIEKTGESDKGVPRTAVNALDPEARREEIARMLAGALVTDEARAAAGRLIGGAAS